MCTAVPTEADACPAPEVVDPVEGEADPEAEDEDTPASEEKEVTEDEDTSTDCYAKTKDDCSDEESDLSVGHSVSVLSGVLALASALF